MSVVSPTAPFENADRFQDPSLIFASFEVERSLHTRLSSLSFVLLGERDRVIDGRDKLDTSLRQNCRAEAPSSSISSAIKESRAESCFPTTVDSLSIKRVARIPREGFIRPSKSALRLFLSVIPSNLPSRARHQSPLSPLLIILLNQIVILESPRQILGLLAVHLTRFTWEGRGEGTAREIRDTWRRERGKKKWPGNGGRGERARFNAISRYNGDTSGRAPITMLLSSPRFVSARASCAVACVACHTCARVLPAFIASLSATIPALSPPTRPEKLNFSP